MYGGRCVPQSQAKMCQQSREGAKQMRVVQQQRRRRGGRGEIVGARGGGGAGEGWAAAERINAWMAASTTRIVSG